MWSLCNAMYNNLRMYVAYNSHGSFVFLKAILPNVFEKPFGFDPSALTYTTGIYVQENINNVIS